MREKKEQLIITFATTSEAMRMEKYCIRQGRRGRLIPLPAEISAGCGLAWKTDPQEQNPMEEELSGAGISYEKMQILIL